MGRKGSLLVIFSLLVLLLQVRSLFAWSVETHRLLSQRAAEVSQLNTGVLTGLGFQNLDTEITGADGADFDGNQKTQSIRLWIRDGAAFEDAGIPIIGTARFLNHFHNPLYQFNDPQRPWRNAGLDDYAFGLHWTGESALLWAQNQGLNDQNGDTATNPVWSWQGVRNAYYQALTLPAKADREAQFAKVFEGLGHLIHLIQDMGVPEHVRNEAHPTDDLLGLVSGLEHWARVAEDQSRIITTFAQQPVFPALSMVRVGTLGDGIEPITNFWDTDQYDGTANTQPITLGPTVGLAEYTNANFFSAHTINSSNPVHQFPYPSVNIQDYHTCQDNPPPNSLAVMRWYISRTECPPVSSRVDHFLAQSLLRDVLNQQPVAITAALQMDNNVRQDYARDLIPRAVGYSAELINYFFRGKLAIVLAGLNEVKVRNDSLEPLNDGTLSIWYDAQDPNDNNAFIRTKLGEITISQSIPIGGMSGLIPASPPSDNKVPDRYWAVFQGTLGSEANAVIGSFTDLEWVEEWDQGFTGRHPWWVKVTDPSHQNETLPGGSFQPTTVQDGILTMTNFRPAGTYGSQENKVRIGISSDPYLAPYNDSFPKTVSPNTSIRIKVDTMSVDHQNPAGCSLFGWEGFGFNWQVIELNFSSGGMPYTIWFTTPTNNAFNFEPYHEAYVYLTMGSEMQINVYQLFQSLGFPVVKAQLDSISARQVLICPVPDNITSPSEDQQQSLQMDYIRILEEAGP